MRKTVLAAGLWLLTAALTVQAAPDDGTFVINITAPDAAQEQTAAQPAPAAPRPARTPPSCQTAPVRRTAQVNERAPQAPAQTYAVQRNDTIWSIANRFLPQDNSYNEFQTVAAIYRANPQAFANGNINQLYRVNLTIPPAAQIAREDQQTGIALLRGTLTTLPPLAAENAQRAQTAPADTGRTQQSAVVQKAEQSTAEPPKSLPPNEYIARETMVREGVNTNQPSRVDENEDTVLLPPEEQNRPDDFYKDDDGSERDSSGTTLGEKNDPGATSSDEIRKLSEADISFKAIRDLIDSTRKSIEVHDKNIDRRLQDALEKSERTAHDAAQTAAHDEVFSIMSRYEAIISDLQQSNADLRANMAKLSKQIDQVRQMSLHNSDELELLRQNVTLETQGNTRIVPQGPLMWILLGIGLMILVLALTLFIFKLRSRAAREENAEDEDFGFDDDLSSTELISAPVIGADKKSAEIDQNDLEAQLEKDEAQHAEETQQAEAASGADDAAEDEKDKAGGQIEPESETEAPYKPSAAPEPELSGSGAAAGRAMYEDEQTRPADKPRGMVDEVKIPRSMIDNDEELARKVADDPAVTAWNSVMDEADKAAAAAKPAQEGKSLDDWAKEQAEKQEGIEIDLDEPEGQSQDDMAAAWEAALKEQAAAEEAQKNGAAPAAESESTQKTMSPEEEMAAQWEAALKEQKDGEHPKIEAPADSAGSAGGSAQDAEPAAHLPEEAGHLAEAARAEDVSRSAEPFEPQSTDAQHLNAALNGGQEDSAPAPIGQQIELPTDGAGDEELSQDELDALPGGGMVGADTYPAASAPAPETGEAPSEPAAAEPAAEPEKLPVKGFDPSTMEFDSNDPQFSVYDEFFNGGTLDSNSKYDKAELDPEVPENGAEIQLPTDLESLNAAAEPEPQIEPEPEPEIEQLQAEPLTAAQEEAIANAVKDTYKPAFDPSELKKADLDGGLSSEDLIAMLQEPGTEPESHAADLDSELEPEGPDVHFAVDPSLFDEPQEEACEPAAEEGTEPTVTESAADEAQSAEPEAVIDAEPEPEPEDVQQIEPESPVEPESEAEAPKPMQWALDPESAFEADPIVVEPDRVESSRPSSPTSEEEAAAEAPDAAADPVEAEPEPQSVPDAAEQGAAFNWTVPASDDDFDIARATQPMPIFESLDDSAADKELDPKLRQDLTDKLNMALLLFESDAQDEAAALTHEVLDKGGGELSARAQELLNKYGSR